LIDELLAAPAPPCVVAACAALGASRSGYYAHRCKPQRARRQQDRELAAVIVDCFRDSRHTYGTPRLRTELRERGHKVGRRRIARLMRQERLSPKQKRRFVPKTTDSGHGRPVPPNLLKDQPPPTAPWQVMVADITYIPTAEGWLYLAAEMDLHTRRITGWETADHMERSLVVAALEQAVSKAPGRVSGLIHHSDQGSQYASADFRALLGVLGLRASMSRRGNCYDHATRESFWSTLKLELVYRRDFATHPEARAAIFDYIEAFYNRERLHRTLDFLSPTAFELITGE
jgi:transposase InsO family protein